MFKQRLDTKTEYDVKHPDENADDDYAGNNDQRIIRRLLTSGPDDLTAFASSIRGTTCRYEQRDRAFFALVSSAIKLLPFPYFVSR